MYVVINFVTKEPVCLTESRGSGIEAACKRAQARAHKLCQGRPIITGGIVEERHVGRNSTFVTSSMHVTLPNGKQTLLHQEFLVVCYDDLPTFCFEDLAGQANPWIIDQPVAA